MSVRQAAIAELRTRLETILTASEFATDAGQLVLLGEHPMLGPADPEASIAIIVQEDEPGYQGENVTVVVPVDVQAIVKADAVDPWMTVEAVIGDIKKAVETDHDLGGNLVSRGLERGPTAPLDREEGATFVGTAVTYRLVMIEKWGAP